jgi:putative acetyltransferase
MNSSESGIRLTTQWHDGYRDDAVGLLNAYQDELGISLETQNFSGELAAFPGHYAPPAGALVLAIRDDHAGGREHVVGLVALRPLEPGVCEMKRLYVAADARGLGLGQKLCERLLAEARRLGYGVMRLDTLGRLEAAIGVYRRLGFRACADYNGNPIPGVQFFELDLSEPRP